MARIRTIKPEFFHDEDLASCSPYARLLAIALLQLADKEGRMRWIPIQAQAHAFPWEALDLSPLLHELQSIGYLRIYTIEGREYADIPGFTKHQRINGKEAQQESKIPPYEQSVESGKQKGKPECFPEKRLGAQGRGTGEMEREDIKNTSASDDAGAVDRPKYSDSFEAFWSEYPNKKDKAKAYAAWKRKKLDSMSAQLIERVRDQKARDAQWLAGFIPHGSTYINGERWEDEIETQRGGRGGTHRKTHADYRRELEQAAEPGLRVVSGERLD